MKLHPVLIALLCSTAVLTACAADQPAASATSATSATSAASANDASSALVKVDTVAGTGAEAVAGKTVVVHYTGWLYKPVAPNQRGGKFDSSLDAGRPFEFRLGAGQVIKGWDQGVAGMKVGGKRTLIIPSALAYGKRGAGGVIPPNADLIFDVELLQVK
jgi:FKBP-type peptidyl-prolyl cis-trans isomerase FkpA